MTTGATFFYIKLHFINDLYLLSILHIQYGYCPHKHKDTCHYQGVNSMVMVKVFNYRTADDAIHNLREGDKKVKNAHINPDLFNRNGA